jgi:hypothetical protein
LLAPEALLYEAATTEAKQRTDCVGKLLSVRRSVSALGPLGHLVKREVDAREPCGRLLRHCHEGGIAYLEKLADREYAYADDERWSVDAERAWREDEVLRAFMHSASQIGKLVPDFGSLHGLEQERLLPRIQRHVHDKELLDSLYEEVRLTFPTLPPQIGPRWATFRRIQAHVLLAGEFVRRYGLKPIESPSKNLVNLYLDVDYLVFGALAGALATRDELLIKMVRAVAPEAEVVN